MNEEPLHPPWPTPPPPGTKIYDYGKALGDTHLINIDLKTTLADFWDILWADSRTVKVFLAKIGDEEVHVGPWATSEDISFDLERRHESRHFTGWIPFPGIPRSSLAYMHQQAALPGPSNGNVLTIHETVTMVGRIPYANYFRVMLSSLAGVEALPLFALCSFAMSVLIPLFL